KAVSAVAKLRKQVEDVCWLWPTQSMKAAQLRAGIECNKQSIRSDREWWCRPKLPAPQPPFPTASQLFCHHANWPWPLAGATSFFKGSVAAEVKLKIGDHNVT